MSNWSSRQRYEEDVVELMPIEGPMLLIWGLKPCVISYTLWNCVDLHIVTLLYGFNLCCFLSHQYNHKSCLHNTTHNALKTNHPRAYGNQKLILQSRHGCRSNVGRVVGQMEEEEVVHLYPRCTRRALVNIVMCMCSFVPPF